MKEGDLHKLVSDYLDLALLPPTWWTTFPADGASRRGCIGLKLGVPDILIVHDSRAYWVELEIPGSRKSRAHRQRQADCRADLHHAGCASAIAISLDEVIDLLTLWGIPLNPAVRIAA